MSAQSPANPYTQNLDKCAANYQPLTPLTFLPRAADVYPAQTAIIHGKLRLSYAEFYARCRRLASALAARGIGIGDTVSVMLANTPPMLEAHYGVPMTGAVLHALNTRLDAAVLAFQLDHAEAKVVICDREFAPVMRRGAGAGQGAAAGDRLRRPEFPQDGRAAVGARLRGVRGRWRSGLRLAHAGGRVGGDRAELHLRHDRQPEGRGLLTTAARR